MSNKYLFMIKNLSLEELQASWCDIFVKNKELENKNEYINSTNRTYNIYCDELIAKINSMTESNLIREKWERIKNNG